MSDAAVKNNESANQFELGAAFLRYRLKPGEITLVHTEVPPDLEGRGIGGALARAALDYARSTGLQVVPLCPFVAAYLKRHPEYADLIRK